MNTCGAAEWLLQRVRRKLPASHNAAHTFFVNQKQAVQYPMLTHEVFGRWNLLFLMMAVALPGAD